MGLVVRTNNSALNACRNLKRNNKSNKNALEKLASGYAINRAADDASGLGITEKMRAQITSLNTYCENAENGISLIQTAEGSMEEIHSMLNRCVELCERAANGIFTLTEREMIQEEVDQIESEIDRISDTANFNQNLLLKGKDEFFLNDSTIIKDGSKNSIPLPSSKSFDLINYRNRTYYGVNITFDDTPSSYFNQSFYFMSNVSDKCCSIILTDDTSTFNNKKEISGEHIIYTIGIGNAVDGSDIVSRISSTLGVVVMDNINCTGGASNVLQIFDRRSINNIQPDAEKGYGVIGYGYAIDPADAEKYKKSGGGRHYCN